MGIDPLARSGIPSEQWGGEALLQVEDAFRLVVFARGDGGTILGLEAFQLRGSGRVPLMDWIADFSAIADLPNASQASCEDATRFLNALHAAGLGPNVRVVVSLIS